jgi:hypothetical protein
VAVTRTTSLTNATTSLQPRSDRRRLLPRTAVTFTTICRMNGRYPQHLSHQRHHLTSAAIYAAHGRNPHHNLQDERPLPAPPLAPTRSPYYGRALTSHELRHARLLPPTTTCKMNGRYPQHLSHQRHHLTSAAIYAAHGRNPHHNLQDERPLPTTPLSPTQPTHFGRALTGYEFCPARPLPSTTTFRMNGRYPHHFSHQRNHLTSAASYAAHDRCRPPQFAG